MSEWIEEDRFWNVSGMIQKLCDKYELSRPMFFRSYIGEKCDYTSRGIIRLFVKGKLDSSYEYHAKHVFCHYLCNLEQTEMSDKVVDIIMDKI